jgi:hypothetical protein
MTLSSSLSATVTDGTVEFTYEVTNDSDDAVDLQFSNSQTHDVVVFEDGEEMWQFSDGQMFMQMLQSETCDPGETLSYTATWEGADSGEYEARAWLAANGVDAEAATAFTA